MKESDSMKKELHIPLDKPAMSEDFLGGFVVDISDFIFKFVCNMLQCLRSGIRVAGIRYCIVVLHSCVHMCFSFQIWFCLKN